MATPSPEVGTVFVDQFPATFQSPLAEFFQLIPVMFQFPPGLMRLKMLTPESWTDGPERTEGRG